MAIPTASALLTVAALAIMLLSCSSDAEISQSELSDAERMSELGKRLVAPWPMGYGCPPLEVVFEATGGDSSEEPPPRALGYYNAHEGLEDAFTKAGGWQLGTDEEYLVRDRVFLWRDDYADWLTDIETTVAGYSDAMLQQGADPDLVTECQFQADTLAHRGRVVLKHVDALLE